MFSCRIDHLVVTSGTLRSGIEFIEDTLCVRMQPGGQHVRMGTHNALLNLGPGMYLEVIAVDPTLPPPKRARWFGLDGVSADSEPRLATWVARTESLDEIQEILTVSPGKTESMERGHWKWKITIPADGQMPLSGAFPSFIQWETIDHPSDRMPNSGVTLQQLEINCDHADLLKTNLQLAGLNGPVVVKESALEQPVVLKATFLTESGARTIG
ncbi:MAG: VOC family protein [Planctomyces sp.]